MAKILSGNRIKLDNGQIVQAQEGGWYDARRFLGGTLLNPGEYEPGKLTSQEVIAQTSPENVAYVQQQRQKVAQNPEQPVVPTTQPTTPVATTPETAVTSPTPFKTQPTIDVQNVYNTAYNTPEITAAQKEIDDAQKAYDEAQAIIDDNPLYSEATRIGKSRKLSDQFEADITRMENKMARLKADAEIKVNVAMKQYDINNQAYKDQLSLFNNLLAAGGLTNASGSDLAGYAVATGIPVSMLESIVSKQKQESVKPQAITSTDNDGNVTVSIVDTMTGKIIGKSSLGQIGAGKTATATENKQTYYNYAKQDARSGATLQQMLQIYGGYLTPNEIYATHNANSPKPSTTTPEQLKTWGINPNISAADVLSAILGAGGK